MPNAPDKRPALISDRLLIWLAEHHHKRRSLKLGSLKFSQSKRPDARPRRPCEGDLFSGKQSHWETILQNSAAAKRLQ